MNDINWKIYLKIIFKNRHSKKVSIKKIKILKINSLVVVD